MPPILVLDTTTHVYEVLESCDCLVETRATSDCIPGRSAVAATRSQETTKFISQSVSTADQSSAGFLSRRINARQLQVQSLVFLGALIIAFTMTLIVPLTVTVQSTSLEEKKNMCNPGTVSTSRTNDPNVRDRGGICTSSAQKLAKTAHRFDSQVRNISSETAS